MISKCCCYYNIVMNLFKTLKHKSMILYLHYIVTPQFNSFNTQISTIIKFKTYVPILRIDS